MVLNEASRSVCLFALLTACGDHLVHCILIIMLIGLIMLIERLIPCAYFTSFVSDVNSLMSPLLFQLLLYFTWLHFNCLYQTM